MLDSEYYRGRRNGKKYNTNPGLTMSENGCIDENLAEVVQEMSRETLPSFILRPQKWSKKKPKVSSLP